MDFLSIIIAALLSEDGSVERHIIWGNSVTAEQVKSFTSIEEFEHVVRGTVAQAFSCVGIDVIHHERDVSLGESIQAFAFRDEHAYELMVPLRRTLLVRSLRIAVEQARTHDAFFIVLDLRRVGELAAVVGKEYSEDLHEKFSSEQAIKHVEDRNNGSGIVVITNESEHALSFDEVDGEKDFASFLALYRVYLSDRDVRMLIEENVEILKSAIDAALLVHLKDPRLFPGLESDLTGKIDVLSRDSSGIDEAIDRPLADTQILRNFLNGKNIVFHNSPRLIFYMNILHLLRFFVKPCRKLRLLLKFYLARVASIRLLLKFRLAREGSYFFFEKTVKTLFIWLGKKR